MFPQSLHGPGKVVYLYPTEDFLNINLRLYPSLDPDFILQICFEHPDRFNEYFPGFNVDYHSAVRKKVRVKWVYDNVRYDCNQELTFWYTQFDQFKEKNENENEVFAFMMRMGTWPFPPVLVEEKFGMQLHCPYVLGQPYHLIEGTHRVSYLRRMLETGVVNESDEIEIIEVENRKNKAI